MGDQPTPQPTGPGSDYYARYKAEQAKKGLQGGSSNTESINSLEFNIGAESPHDYMRVENTLQPAQTLFRNETDPNSRTLQWGATRPGVPDGGISVIDQAPQMPAQQGPGFYTVESMWEPVSDGWSRERVIRLQSALAGTGILTSFTAGTWDNTSASAFEKVLNYANSQSIGYPEAIKQLASMPAGTTVEDLLAAQKEKQSQIDAAKARTPYVGNTYLKPDIENVRANVRNMITSTVGRGYIDEAMVERISQNFMEDFRGNFEQQERLARERYETQQTNQIAANTGLSKRRVANLAGEEVPYGVTAEDEAIDVEANMQTALEEVIDPIAGSIEERDRAETANQSIFNVFSSFGALSGS